MNVVELFKRKRVVGWNTVTGKQTAHSLKKDGVWQEMISDIWGCETHLQLMRCSLLWSVKTIEDKWPEEWVTLASEEFGKAAEALAACQAE